VNDRQSPQLIRKVQPGCNNAVADLLPAYALGGIDLVDRTLVEQHLRTCASCRDTVDAYSGIAATFPLLVPQDQEPDPGTWDRIASRIVTEDATPLTTTHPHAQQAGSIPPGVSRSVRSPQPTWTRFLPATLVLPLVLALVVVGTWANSMRHDLDELDGGGENSSISTEMLNDSSVRTYAVERSCANCRGSGQLGLSDSSQMGMMVAWDFDPSEDHMVWGLTETGEITKVCQLYVHPNGGVMQTFMLPSGSATLLEIYITDETGQLIYVAHLQPLAPAPTAPPVIN
jgi:hypothetical protein